MMLVTLAAEFATHQMQAGVDAGRGPGAGDQVSVVDEQHVAVYPRGRIHPRQLLGVHPVRGTPAPVQQAGRARHERSGADGQDRRAALRGRPERGQSLRRIGLRPLRGMHGRDRHQVSTREPVESVLGNHLCADGRVQGPARLRPAYPEVDARDTVGFAVDAEYLADDAEFEDRELFHHQNGHRPEHGSILS